MSFTDLFDKIFKGVSVPTPTPSKPAIPLPRPTIILPSPTGIGYMQISKPGLAEIAGYEGCYKPLDRRTRINYSARSA